MNPRKNDIHLQIKVAKNENLYDIQLCAEEFIDLIKNFEEKFLNKEIIMMTAFYDKILSGFLVAEDKSQKIDAIEKILPSTCLHLLFVNSKFRNKRIGKVLLEAFIETQKKKGIASIYIKLPHKYKNGIKFLQKFDFHQTDVVKSKIILEKNLWNDYGVRECQNIGDNVNDLFS